MTFDLAKALDRLHEINNDDGPKPLGIAFDACDRIERLEARVQALSMAFRKFADHEDDCPVVMEGRWRPDGETLIRCSCGFDEASALLEEKEPTT